MLYHNTGNETIYIHKWSLPDQELEHPLFKVTCNDVPVKYIGPLAKRGAPTINDVIPLAPGKTIATSVRLSSAYDMSKTCKYGIKYNMPTERVTFKHPRSLRSILVKSIRSLQTDIQSNDMELTIEGRPNIQRQQNKIMNLRKRAAIHRYSACWPGQKSQIISAVSSAVSYADNAFKYMNVMKPSGTNRYTNWFDHIFIVLYAMLHTMLTLCECETNESYVAIKPIYGDFL
ncbi:unnamed protein product [Rotaria sp. Silwood2]|nr:unnamed protein product [Rotaria sp. Silwood2]CAF2920886.1 unnamed protein product [Rotaria sp. Silwood2]CAF2944306.1 unnamed protein product [Rotaria sp. Silwood2]CAF3871036.1 unnamed protein product [Rotaria sp. Silwood2]CAF4013946.1 unnamed protein product [Rotaria sp. Silwood2]